MADADGMGAMPSSQMFANQRDQVLGTRVNNEKDNVIEVDDGVGDLNQNEIGNLQISVVEGRNFEVGEDGHTFRPSVELQIGEHKVSVINSDLLLDYESMVGRATIPISDLLYSGTRVQWIQMKDPTDKGVGEVCLVLRYSNHQALCSSTAASTSSESRDENQYGLKALLCQFPPYSGPSNLRCISNDSHNITHDDLPRGMKQEVLKEDQVGGLLTRGTLIKDVLPSSPTTLGRPTVLQMKSLFEEFDESQKFVCNSKPDKKDRHCEGSQPCTGQHRMVAFVGALVAILATMAWGSNFCKKRLEDQEKSMGQMCVCTVCQCGMHKCPTKHTSANVHYDHNTISEYIHKYPAWPIGPKFKREVMPTKFGDAKFCDDTTYDTDYSRKEIGAKFMHAQAGPSLAGNMPMGQQFDGNSEYIDRYRKHPLGPRYRHQPAVTKFGDAKFCDDTTYDTDYIKWPMAMRTPFKPPMTTNDTGAFDNLTTYNCDYVDKSKHMTKWVRNKDVKPVSTGPFCGITTHATDYGPKPLCGKTLPIKYDCSLGNSGAKFDGDTTYHDSYRAWQLSKPIRAVRGDGPISAGKFKGESTYTTDFINRTLPPRCPVLMRPKPTNIVGDHMCY